MGIEDRERRKKGVDFGSQPDDWFKEQQADLNELALRLIALNILRETLPDFDESMATGYVNKSAEETEHPDDQISDLNEKSLPNTTNENAKQIEDDDELPTEGELGDMQSEASQSGNKQFENLLGSLYELEPRNSDLHPSDEHYTENPYDWLYDDDIQEIKVLKLGEMFVGCDIFDQQIIKISDFLSLLPVNQTVEIQTTIQEYDCTQEIATIKKVQVVEGFLYEISNLHTAAFYSQELLIKFLLGKVPTLVKEYEFLNFGEDTDAKEPLKKDEISDANSLERYSELDNKLQNYFDKRGRTLVFSFGGDSFSLDYKDDNFVLEIKGSEYKYTYDFFLELSAKFGEDVFGAIESALLDEKQTSSDEPRKQGEVIDVETVFTTALDSYFELYPDKSISLTNSDNNTEYTLSKVNGEFQVCTTTLHPDTITEPQIHILDSSNKLYIYLLNNGFGIERITSIIDSAKNKNSKLLDPQYTREKLKNLLGQNNEAGKSSEAKKSSLLEILPSVQDLGTLPQQIKEHLEYILENISQDKTILAIEAHENYYKRSVFEVNGGIEIIEDTETIFEFKDGKFIFEQNNIERINQIIARFSSLVYIKKYTSR